MPCSLANIGLGVAEGAVLAPGRDKAGNDGGGFDRSGKLNRFTLGVASGDGLMLVVLLARAWNRIDVIALGNWTAASVCGRSACN